MAKKEEDIILMEKRVKLYRPGGKNGTPYIPIPKPVQEAVVRTCLGGAVEITTFGRKPKNIGSVWVKFGLRIKKGELSPTFYMECVEIQQESKEEV